MSMAEGVSRNSIKGYEKYSIKISLSHFNLMDFNLTKEKKKELYNTGYDSVMDNIDKLMN